MIKENVRNLEADILHNDKLIKEQENYRKNQ